MKIFNRICSIIVIFTISAFIISFSQNLVFRSESVYGFYFNDSRAVDKIRTSLSSNEMADEIASFMGSWMPEKFEILEYTGYDYESVFTEEEGQNMMAAKRAIDVSGIVCVVSLILTAAIYVYFLRNERKKVLSDMYKISMGLTLALAVLEMMVISTHQGREKLFEVIGIVPMDEGSQILTLLGTDFINMASVFLIIVTLIVSGAATYINFLLTRPPRLFY